MRRIALASILATSACSALVGLEPPSFDAPAIAGEAGADAAPGGGDDGPVTGDAPAGSDAPSDAPSDRDAGLDADAGPIDPCAGASLCLDFEDGTTLATNANSGMAFVDDSISHSPTHCLAAATNAVSGGFAYATWSAGTYASGTRVSLWYESTSAFFQSASTPIGQITFSATTTSLRIDLGPTTVQLAWLKNAVEMTKVALDTRGASGVFTHLVFTVRDDGVYDAMNGKVLGSAPDPLSGPMVLELGVLDNLGAAEAVRFDDVIVHPP